MRGIEVRVERDLKDTDKAVRLALAEEGFGVLTEIDVAATLKQKLGIERPPLRILGACNPNLAHRALELDPSAALVLPCNVVIEPDPSGGTRVTFADPRELMPGASFRELADEASTRFARVATRISRADESG
ncbi:MAG: DUF302 domain-containing protein [Acidimicrobiales bacterium]